MSFREYEEMNSLVDFTKQVSPYYKEKHRLYRAHVRKFVETECLPYADKWIKEGKVPQSFYKTMATYGGTFMFPWGYAKEWNGFKWDPFFLIIWSQEMSRSGLNSGTFIHSMSLTPVLLFGKNPIHRECVESVQSGDKMIALAISELRGGSDVAQIQTSAVKFVNEKDGKEYFKINGGKYWITAGHHSEWFATLCRTSTPDLKKGETKYHGLSVILIPRQKGVFTDPIHLQSGFASGTAQVTFANVIVPATNLIGEEGMGFKYIMYGFNNERFIIASGAVASGIVCVCESIKWAKERETFGKKLIDHQVIQHKIARMSREVIACQSFLERVAFQLMTDRYGRKDKSIARNIALLKVQCSKMVQMCAIEASQIFGGRSYVVNSGRGKYVERIYRAVRATAIAGGSEEVMSDFAVRQAKL